MSKTIEVDDCTECKEYYDYGGNNLSRCGDTGKILCDVYTIPSWCPLPDSKEQGWQDIETGYPEYYELCWCSDGVGVVLGTLTGRSYEPERRVWKNKENTGCVELSGIKYWKLCKRPSSPTEDKP